MARLLAGSHFTHSSLSASLEMLLRDDETWRKKAIEPPKVQSSGSGMGHYIIESGGGCNCLMQYGRKKYYLFFTKVESPKVYLG